MPKLILAAAALSAALAAGSASAHHGGGHYATPGVDARQHRQAARIYDGVRRGALTPAETRSLARGQAHVNRLERRFKADGVVTAAERARLHAAQDRQSRRIYRKKHNLRGW